MDKTERRKEFAKVMRWLTKHEADRYVLIDFGEPYTGEDYLRVLRNLEKDSLEYLIPLLLVVEPRRVEYDNALRRFAAEALIDRWESLGVEAFLQELEGLTKEEMLRQKVRDEVTKERCAHEKAPEIPDGI